MITTKIPQENVHQRKPYRTILIGRFGCGGVVIQDSHRAVMRSIIRPPRLRPIWPCDFLNIACSLDGTDTHFIWPPVTRGQGHQTCRFFSGGDTSRQQPLRLLLETGGNKVHLLSFESASVSADTRSGFPGKGGLNPVPLILCQRAY
jgi:hypothetical protein